MSDSSVGQLRKFGIRDLYNMYRSRGWKLPIMYIFENLLYDFTRGVSTHQYLQANELQIESTNAKHSVLYMSSWTRVIRKSTRQAVSALSLPNGEPISLIDVGSGKGKVLLVWEEMYKDRKEFPILGAESVFASRAALAAWRLAPEKYEAFHSALMANKGPYSELQIRSISSDLDIDGNALIIGMKSDEIDANLDENYALAQSLGISGTPAFIVGEELVPGAIDEDTLKGLIKIARGKK